VETGETPDKRLIQEGKSHYKTLLHSCTANAVHIAFPWRGLDIFMAQQRGGPLPMAAGNLAGGPAAPLTSCWNAA
jgi:hypothetical protein